MKKNLFSSVEKQREIYDISLLIFARKLAEEMNYLNYPKEWSRKPLSNLLPLFWKLLDRHPAKLGTLLSNAYGKMFAKDKAGNINQLLTDGSLPLVKNKAYYDFLYLVEQLVTLTYFDEPPADLEDSELLEELARSIVQTFAELTPEQENEHRSLERVSLALYPVYLSGMKDRTVGWDLQEYADFWRKMNSDERRKLSEELLGYW